MEVDGQIHAPTAVHPRKTHFTHGTGGCVRTRHLVPSVQGAVWAPDTWYSRYRRLCVHQTLGTRGTGGCVGTRDGLDDYKNSPPPTFIRSPDRSVRSGSLYGLHYPGPHFSGHVSTWRSTERCYTNLSYVSFEIYNDPTGKDSLS
jgi:hypothetical protein